MSGSARQMTCATPTDQRLHQKGAASKIPSPPVFCHTYYKVADGVSDLRLGDEVSTVDGTERKHVVLSWKRQSQEQTLTLRFSAQLLAILTHIIHNEHYAHNLVTAIPGSDAFEKVCVIHVLLGHKVVELSSSPDLKQEL
mmetsp:Transcript_35947/g.70659  ORF Transcript_35947/g.70659 Transcript_35947/m.70659 type:complete len:140 (-) Transcript_35947:64-483(-)